ncbi:hypothetical protein B0A54_12543 [Friedmanniomyces endolithicus]|uniref:Uncharacterized protein n=1 Tax=Friedmanniomyces endolithicus TaxID=329885 RepID=A0A4U0UI39_9PEZI|nr:hypothetical protein B0A54_12543 [Friedmanniomyces endolithicus]
MYVTPPAVHVIAAELVELGATALLLVYACGWEVELEVTDARDIAELGADVEVEAGGAAIELEGEEEMEADCGAAELEEAADDVEAGGGAAELLTLLVDAELVLLEAENMLLLSVLLELDSALDGGGGGGSGGAAEDEDEEALWPTVLVRVVVLSFAPFGGGGVGSLPSDVVGVGAGAGAGLLGGGGAAAVDVDMRMVTVVVAFAPDEMLDVVVWEVVVDAFSTMVYCCPLIVVVLVTWLGLSELEDVPEL